MKIFLPQIERILPLCGKMVILVCKLIIKKETEERERLRKYLSFDIYFEYTTLTSYSFSMCSFRSDIFLHLRLHNFNIFKYIIYSLYVSLSLSLSRKIVHVQAVRHWLLCIRWCDCAGAVTELCSQLSVLIAFFWYYAIKIL